MRVKRKSWQIIIERPLEDVWNFFSMPENLEKVTPEHVNFKTIGGKKGEVVYPGMIVQHQLAPLLGIKMLWTTEIKQVKEQEYFIDEQRFGPYAFWHHQHWFEAVENGTKMTDILHYKVPYGIIGTIADALFVNKMVDEIFEHREEVFKKVF